MSSCCSETIFCCRVRISSRPVRSPTWASRGYSWPPKLRWRDQAVLGAVEQRAPGLELPDPLRRLLGVQLGHPPVVEELAAAHGVAEVHLPVVLGVDVAHRRGDAALGHHRVRLAEQRLADDRGRACPASRAAIAARRPAPPAPMTTTSYCVPLELGHASHRSVASVRRTAGRRTTPVASRQT